MFLIPNFITFLETLFTINGLSTAVDLIGRESVVIPENLFKSL